MKRATVWWIDAHHGGEQYATIAEVIKDHNPMLRADTAWVVQDDEIGISLALSRLIKTDDEQYLQRSVPSTSDVVDVMFIPRRMVERVEYLATGGTDGA